MTQAASSGSSASWAPRAVDRRWSLLGQLVCPKKRERERESVFLSVERPPVLQLGVAQNSRVTQVLVFGSLWQGAILVHLFEPQPGG